jgi:hypothetical protein
MKIQSTISKQTTLLLITLVSLSTLFLPLTTLRAATLTNGMDAAYVIGQTDFTSNTATLTQSGLGAAFDVAYDNTNQLLYVVDNPGLRNNRVLVYDLSGGITNGMNASYVLGQDDFISNATGTDRSSFNGVSSVEVDSANGHVFVGDGGNNRILVFDVSTSITNGMDASYVLGQSDFGSSGATLTQSGIYEANSMEIVGDNLYVLDSNYRRALVFDVSTIVNGENATYVLGQPDFTTSTFTVTGANFTAPLGLGSGFLDGTPYLFVGESLTGRTLVFDISSLSNGMSASYVLGVADFTSMGNPLVMDQSSLALPYGSVLDDNERLFMVDQMAQRIMVYDFSGGIENDMDASYVLGRPDFTQALPVGPTQSTITDPTQVDYDTTNDYLFAVDGRGRRVLVFDLSPTLSSSSGSGWNYTHPPLCSAQFSPNTITKGESTTLSWNTTWPTERENNYYTKVPGEGLYSQNVQSLTLQPQHTTEYTIAVFNLWGANFCSATITVLDEEGDEVITPQNSQLTASAASSNFFRPIVALFAKLFVR